MSNFEEEYLSRIGEDFDSEENVKKQVKPKTVKKTKKSTIKEDELCENSSDIMENPNKTENIYVQILLEERSTVRYNIHKMEVEQRIINDMLLKLDEIQRNKYMEQIKINNKTIESFKIRLESIENVLKQMGE